MLELCLRLSRGAPSFCPSLIFFRALSPLLSSNFIFAFSTAVPRGPPFRLMISFCVCVIVCPFLLMTSLCVCIIACFMCLCVCRRHRHNASVYSGLACSSAVLRSVDLPSLPAIILQNHPPCTNGRHLKVQPFILTSPALHLYLLLNVGELRAVLAYSVPFHPAGVSQHGPWRITHSGS